MSSCHTFRPVPGQCGPRGRGPLPAPPFDPQDYWATRKLVSSLFGTLETSKLDRSDVVDPAVATEAGKAADAKKTQEELDRILGVASGALALAESKADKLSSRQLEAVNSGIDANKVAKIAQNESAISEEVSRATTEEARLQALINAIKTFDAVVADSLPSPSEQYSKKLYLIPSTNPETRNVKDEFICVKLEDVWGWEQVGSTAITIEFDNEPTEGSQKAARSGGIWSFVNGIIGSLTLGWEKITGKPSTFPPSDHSHAQSQVTGLAGALAGKLPSVLSKTDALSVENPDPLELPIPMIEYTVLDLVAAKKGWIWNGYAKFNNLRGKPTTLAGYGITDAYTKAEADAKLAGKADVSDDGFIDDRVMFIGKLESHGGAPTINVRDRTLDGGDWLVNGDVQCDGGHSLKFKADKAIPSSAGNLASLTADGNLADSGIAKTNVATKAELSHKLNDGGEVKIERYIDGNPPSLDVGNPGSLASWLSVHPFSWHVGYRGVNEAGSHLYGTFDKAYYLRNKTADYEPTDADEIAVKGDISGLVSSKADRASIAPEYSATSAYSVGSIVYHDGNIYQCKTAIAEGGEAWNAEHWELMKLDDFFTESNSLLTGTIDARLPYPLYAVPSTGLLKDRAINTTSLASVTVPDNFTDLLIRATVASSLSVTMPEAIATKYGDTFPGEAGEYLITITKTGAAEAYVRTIKLEEVANA